MLVQRYEMFFQLLFLLKNKAVRIIFFLLKCQFLFMNTLWVFPGVFVAPFNITEMSKGDFFNASDY